MNARRTTTPLERLIQRSLKNGIKTLSGQDHRLHPVGGGQSRLVTYRGDQVTFLALLQHDAAHLEPAFDQGQQAAEFAAMVAQVAAGLEL